MTIPALLRCDSYKLGHADQYPEKTEYIYSNFTPRSSKHFNVPEQFKDDKVVFFCFIPFLKNFNKVWTDTFFNRDIKEVLSEFEEHSKDFYPYRKVAEKRIRKLHEFGMLPLDFRCLPEGTVVPIKTPLLTVTNTHKDFYWLPNYIESWISADMWKSITIATIARMYRKIVTHYANISSTNYSFIDYQCHDFSMRGMSGFEDGAFNGMGHLLYFSGSDSIPAAINMKKYYNIGNDIIKSVPATEHSVMCAGGKESEIETFRRLLKIYPEGPVSIVSDTWDFFKVITEYATELKDEILDRNGTVIFRPDSGNPVDIICGNKNYHYSSPEGKGALNCLWEIFGGTFNSKGYKVLNDKIRLIYGDSITLDIANEMLSKMVSNNYATDNVVLGVGSYSYNYISRDTLGFAMKATNQILDGKSIPLFKDPITDDGVKRSLKGFIGVYQNENGDIITKDQLSTYKDIDSLLGIPMEEDLVTIMTRAMHGI